MYSPEVENYFYVIGAIDVRHHINKYIELIEEDMFQLEPLLNAISKMFHERYYFDNNEKKLPLVESQLINYMRRRKHTYTFTSDNGTNYAIRFYCYDLNSISYRYLVDDFADKYQNYNRIIVTPGYNNEIQSYALEKSTTIFSTMELANDILKIPQIEVFSQTKIIKDFKDINYCNTRTIPMHHIIPRYYGLKPGDICMIKSKGSIRLSTNGSGNRRKTDIDKTCADVNVAEIFQNKTNNGYLIVA